MFEEDLKYLNKIFLKLQGIWMKNELLLYRIQDVSS